MPSEETNQPSLLIFDDASGLWGPLSDLRAVMQFRTGVLKTRQRIERVFARAAAAIWLTEKNNPSVTSSGSVDGTDPFTDHSDIDATSDQADHITSSDVSPSKVKESVTALPTDIPANYFSPTTPTGMVAMEMMRNPGAVLNALPKDGNWMLVNSRWTAVRYVDEVTKLRLGSVLLQPNGQMVAAHVPALLRDRLLALLVTGESPANIPGLPAERLPQRALIERPWHILDGLEEALHADLAGSPLPLFDPIRFTNIASRGEYPIHVSHTAKFSPFVVLDARQGPIVIDHGAFIGSHAVLEGPCYIGQGTNLTAHAHIRPNTVIGPRCSVGGEVSHSILHGMTNKAHTGYLGNALVGKWVNLGADTNVSNLKNTYSTVRMQLQADKPAEDSGMTKLGPLIGDYVRTAIGTRILTGSCIGTGAMIALSAFSPKFVDRFSFLTDEGNQTYRPDAFIQTARAMLERRNYKLAQTEEDHLRALMALKK